MISDRYDMADTNDKAKTLYEWLGELGHTQKKLANRIKGYQRFHGMEVVDGWAGRATERLMTSPRCACPDIMRSRTAENALCAWSRRSADNLGIRIRDRFGRHSVESVHEVFQEAIDAWSAVANLRGEIREGSTHILVTYGRIGGPGGTLAWSELPCGPDRTLMQKYDSGDSWGISPFGGPHKPGLIPLILTAIHELGHALGLDHSRNRRDIMFPSLQTVDALGPGDIREIVERYGKAETPPPPPDDPPTGDGEVQQIVITGRDLRATGIIPVDPPALI